jgi:hypothetical protein
MAASSRKYYTLLTREDGSMWTIHFGDYDREVVEQERQDMLEGYHSPKTLRIITTGHLQRDINAAVDRLNAGLKGSK